jgi:hypothetical protein
MTAPDIAKIAAGKHCFTYCGDDKCDCPAKGFSQTLAFIAPALPVLSSLCRGAGLKRGAAKADEMDAAVRAHLQEQKS